MAWQTIKICIARSAIYSFSFLAFLSEYSELDLVTSKVPLGPEVILEIQ